LNRQLHYNGDNGMQAKDSVMYILRANRFEKAVIKYDAASRHLAPCRKLTKLVIVQLPVKIMPYSDARFAAG